MEKKLHCGDLFKRVLSLALALVMVLGFAPVPHAHAADADTTVYLKPNANWLQHGARFAIYYWTGSGNAWVDMSDADEDRYYEGKVPSDCSGLIFCRMIPGTTENNWDNTWNQTADLTLPTDGANCYTVADDAWSKGDGTWTTYTPATTEPEVPDVPDEPATEKTYIIAGDKAALFGTSWDPTNTDNKMSLVNGLYTKTYENVAVGTYSLKVTDGTWDNAWGSNGQNYVFEVSAACDVTVTFNEATKAVNVTGANVAKVTKLEITSMYVAGSFNGWNVTKNQMTKTADNIYEITLKDIAKGSYEFKFAADGAWDHSWGKGAAEGEAVYNGQNIPLVISYDLADVTLKLDLTNYNHETGNGATYSVTITEVEAEPTVDYYLVGYINGADYGCEADYENLGEYKFVNGKLTATFTADSYVFVKTGDNANWYLAEAYNDAATSAVLKSGGSEKLKVPANTEVVFTLVENEDGTLTLSYAPAVEGTKVTIHFLKPETWGSTINGYVWLTDGTKLFGDWPGKAVAENADHAGWYDVEIVTEEPQSFNFIFNDGSSQTGDLSTGEITGDTELWVVGEEVLKEAPKSWTNKLYTVTVYFHNTAEWETVYTKFGQGDTWNAIPGYEAYMEGFGVEVAKDSHNSGWHTVTIEVADDNTAINGLFNNGSWGDGNQTANWTTGPLTGKQEFWYDNGALGTTAPAGWIDPNRTAHVPGTFPGPSWDASSNQMTYDAELGLYVYTFENVPPANYEFKIAINGGWGENYGAGGVRDGGNIAVAVPETMDVIVYYNDKTHNAVTSVSYKFVEVSVSGTGIETTALTDEGLTGIYSGTVAMAKGIYTDVVITCDGKEYKFNEIEVKEDKDVTFYIDPVTGIFYCDASGIPVNTAEIYFNSQDEAYKAPFGAVAAGEDISFSIKTGEDVTSAVLVIKGLASYPMEKNEETGLWSCTASVANIGEYDYYFVVSNGSAVAIYGDDDGYYGEGTVTDLVSVIPYDLVVHEDGFKTPDWMKDAVIYQIFPDRFFDGDETNNKAQTWARGTVDYEYITDWYTLPENPEQKALLDEATYKSTGAHWGDGEWSNEIYGGDLEGITERIGYLKALGVNVIYLNPVFWSISNHRYDAVDYTEIDPILGTLGDFEELVAVAEANGMHIILDGVFNHVSDDSVYFDRYYKFLPDAAEKFDGKIGAYPYWAYVYDYMAENEASQADAEAAAKAYFSKKYGITDYSYTEWFAVSSTTMTTADTIGLRAGKPVYSYEGWWGYDSMPIIYATNGSEYQTGNWAEEIINDPNGTDSVTEYWISKGMDGWRLDVANEVSDETWQNFRASVKALDSNAVIIGEIWDDATKYLMGDMYDSVMNYQFRNAVTGFAMGTGAEATTKLMEKIRERYPEEAFYAMMNLVGSHDTTRILSYLDGIGDDRADKSMAAAFPTYEGTSAVAKQRQYLVSFLQFTYAGAPTIYYGDEIGMVGADDPDDRRAFEWGKGNKELVEWYAKLAAIREAYPALRTGSVQPIDTRSDNLMGFSRTLNDQTLIVVANNSANEQKFVPENAYLESYVDLISGKTYVATDSSYTVPAYSGIILVAVDEVENLDLNLAGLAPAYDESYIVAERQTPADGEETHSHKYGEDGTVVEPTCTEQGYTSYTCECCDVYMTDFVKPTGHDYTETVTEPTCTEKGYTTYTCTVCEDTYTDNEVDALGHNFVESVTNPTCTETGKTLLTCEGCGECVISKEVDALGHNYEGGACTRCGEDDPNSVPSTPITPAKPNWKNWLDKIFGKWFGDKEETPTEPSEPETSEPTEPETSEPEESVPAEPVKPSKPSWGGIIDWFRGLWG